MFLEHPPTLKLHYGKEEAATLFFGFTNKLEIKRKV